MWFGNDIKYLIKQHISQLAWTITSQKVHSSRAGKWCKEKLGCPGVYTVCYLVHVAAEMIDMRFPDSGISMQCMRILLMMH